MVGVPSIMQAMLDEVAPKLEFGVRMLSETGGGCARRRHRDATRRDRQGQACGRGRELTFDPQHGPNTNVVLRARDTHKLAQAKRAVEKGLERVPWAKSAELRSLTAKTGVGVP